MKTYILSNLNRIAKYSKELDAKAILYNKNWEVFNEDNEKEVLIFRPKGELLIVRKGIVTKSSWELLPTGSILINANTNTYLLNAAFVDDYVLALQLDGTNEYMLMLESEAKQKFQLDSISKINFYIENKSVPKENKSISYDTTENLPTDYLQRIWIFICIVLFIALFVVSHSINS